MKIRKQIETLVYELKTQFIPLDFGFRQSAVQDKFRLPNFEFSFAVITCSKMMRPKIRMHINYYLQKLPQRRKVIIEKLQQRNN